MIITANLKAQAQHLVDTPDDQWSDDLVCEVFGSQDYEGGLWRFNSHCCGFSPAYITKLLKEAGFWKVEVGPLPGCATDMVIWAHKSEAHVTR